MTTTTQTVASPVMKLCDLAAVGAALKSTDVPCGDIVYPPKIGMNYHQYPAEGIPVPLLREYADRLRGVTDRAWPTGPGQVADALEQVAAATETRPAKVDDVLAVSQDDQAVILQWADRCRERSPLLMWLVGGLTEIGGGRWPKVQDARDALGVLADADLLLPGVDAALRPVLTPYAVLFAEDVA